MLPTKFKVNWSFFSGTEVKNIFSKWLSRRPSSISYWNDFSYFWSTSQCNASYQLKSIDLLVQEKNRSKMATTVAILDFGLELFKQFLIYKSPRCFLPKFWVKWPFGSGEAKKQIFKFAAMVAIASPIGTILAIFDLQVAPMLPTQLQVNWPFYSEKSKNRFSRWPPLGFQIGTISAIFDLQVTPMLPTKFRVSWPFASGEETKIYFQAGRYCGHLGFSIGTILAIFDLCHPNASYWVTS